MTSEREDPAVDAAAAAAGEGLEGLVAVEARDGQAHAQATSAPPASRAGEGQAESVHDAQEQVLARAYALGALLCSQVFPEVDAVHEAGQRLVEAAQALYRASQRDREHASKDAWLRALGT